MTGSPMTDDDPCDLCDGTGRRWIVHIKNLALTREEQVEIDLGPCRACGGSGIIEGGRAQLIADIESVAEDLRELEARLANARDKLRRLLASLGPISMTMNWRR